MYQNGVEVSKWNILKCRKLPKTRKMIALIAGYYERNIKALRLALNLIDKEIDDNAD